MSVGTRAKSPRSRIGDFARIVIVFAVLGPPVGSILVWFFASILRMVNMGFGSSDPVGYLSALGIALLFGYPIALGYALAAGIFVAFTGIWMRWNNVLTVFVAAAVATGFGGFLLGLYFPDISGETTILGMFALSLAATLVCWFFTRGIVRATWQSA